MTLTSDLLTWKCCMTHLPLEQGMLIDLLTGIGQSRFLVTDRDCHLLVGLSELSAAVVLATTPSSARTASCGSTRSAVASATIRLMADPNYVPRCDVQQGSAHGQQSCDWNGCPGHVDNFCGFSVWSCTYFPSSMHKPYRTFTNIDWAHKNVCRVRKFL